MRKLLKKLRIEIEPKLLETYSGRYQFPSSQAAGVTREGGHLFLQAEGDVKTEFYSKSDQNFFVKIMDAQ